VICLFARRRLGAFLDGALDSGPSRAVVRHVDRCPRCHEEIDRLRRMAALIRQVMPVAAEPDWTGFWPGVVRGIQESSVARPVVASPRWGRTWVLGSAVAGVAAISLVVGYQRWQPARSEEDTAVVTAADTQYPGGTMVYHTPDNVAVVWVFDE
jgi:anti-sigma factor RsiW